MIIQSDEFKAWHDDLRDNVARARIAARIRLAEHGNLGDIARARGMSQLARETGLSRERLYQALSAKGSPEFGTIMKVIRALGLTLHVEIARA